MPIKFRCPACGQKLSIASRKAGSDVNCPACQWLVTVPGDPPAKPTEPSESPGLPTQNENGVQGDSQQPADNAARNEPPAVPDSDSDKEIAPQHQPQYNAEEDETDFTIRKPATDFEELDLTPMVDVTFLLLIFFMITASFSTQKSIEIPPPEPDQQGAQQTPDLEELEQNSIFVEIDADNRIFVEDEEVTSLPEIPRKLADLRNESDRNEIVIMPDDLARHEIVVEVIDAANEVRMQRIRIASRKQDG